MPTDLAVRVPLDCCPHSSHSDSPRVVERGWDSDPTNRQVRFADLSHYDRPRPPMFQYFWNLPIDLRWVLSFRFAVLALALRCIKCEVTVE